jgi:hypothetical protein
LESVAGVLTLITGNTGAATGKGKTNAKNNGNAKNNKRAAGTRLARYVVVDHD